ncbi:MAG: hypothetical protein RL168_383 [Bacteroidota bacterium]
MADVFDFLKPILGFTWGRKAKSIRPNHHARVQNAMGADVGMWVDSHARMKDGALSDVNARPNGYPRCELNTGMNSGRGINGGGAPTHMMAIKIKGLTPCLIGVVHSDQRTIKTFRAFLTQIDNDGRGFAFAQVLGIGALCQEGQSPCLTRFQGAEVANENILRAIQRGAEGLGHVQKCLFSNRRSA